MAKSVTRSSGVRFVNMGDLLRPKPIVRRVWVVERRIDEQWTPHGWKATRSEARRVAKRLGKLFRVAPYIPCDGKR
ncbi:MAG: hypothetical protein ABL982_03495 [Vicinamibacterales bacterium]